MTATELLPDDMYKRQAQIEVWNYIPFKEKGLHTEYANCSCNPTVKLEDGTVKIIHNKLNGRKTNNQAPVR